MLRSISFSEIAREKLCNAVRNFFAYLDVRKCLCCDGIFLTVEKNTPVKLSLNFRMRDSSFCHLSDISVAFAVERVVADKSENIAMDASLLLLRLMTRLACRKKGAAISACIKCPALLTGLLFSGL